MSCCAYKLQSFRYISDGVLLSKRRLQLHRCKICNLEGDGGKKLLNIPA